MRLGGAKRLALRPAADRPRDVQGGCGLCPTREDEALELGKLGVEAVAVLLEAVDDRLLDPQPALDLARDREIGADVEELVLDALERLTERVAQLPGEHDAECSVQLVDGPERDDARVELRDPRPVAE